MSRLFIRDSLFKEELKDFSNSPRERDKILNFRVTSEEKELIEKRITLTGLSKSEFFINSCLYQKIVTVGNVKTFSEIQKELMVIGECLKAISDVSELEYTRLESLRTIMEIFDGLKGDDENGR